MSLLDDASADHAAAVALLVDELKKGALQERAALLNLREETRVDVAVRADFHAALAASSEPKALERLREACRGGVRSLEVTAPQRSAIPAEWWTYMTITKLRRFDYLDAVDPLAVDPLSRVPLKRPYGRDAGGMEHPFWISTCDIRDADEVRDRLGLAHIPVREAIYRLTIPANAAPTRELHIPTMLDSDAQPPWRCPPPAHTAPWGMTRDLRNDDAAEPELLTTSHASDARSAVYVGLTTRPPSDTYLSVRFP